MTRPGHFHGPHRSSLKGQRDFAGRIPPGSDRRGGTAVRFSSIFGADGFMGS